MDCNYYVAISECESDDPIEVPLEQDGGLLLTSVQSQFPSAVGLKFRNPSNRSFRGVRLADGVLYPPEGGWGDTVYLVNTAKAQTDNKRKMEDSAQAEVSKTKRPTPQASDLVVLNLPYHYTKENLMDYFSKHGDIAFAQIMKNAAGESRGFAFIRFVNYDDQKRVNGCHFVIDGRKVHVKKPNSQAPELCKVFVGRLTGKVTKDDLWEHFEQFGPVSEIYYDEGRKQYGFVTFDESSSAERALVEKAHYIKDVHIVVRPADPVDKSKHGATTTALPSATSYDSSQLAPPMSYYNPQQMQYMGNPAYTSDKFAPPSPYDGYSKASYSAPPPAHLNHQPMSPSGPSSDAGAFGQEVLNAMAKMMASAMSGNFNSQHSAHNQTPAMPPVPGRMNYETSSSFRMAHSSDPMHPSGFRYPPVAMTNPYRSPPHDPYAHMY